MSPSDLGASVASAIAVFAHVVCSFHVLVLGGSKGRNVVGRTVGTYVLVAHVVVVVGQLRLVVPSDDVGVVVACLLTHLVLLLGTAALGLLAYTLLGHDVVFVIRRPLGVAVVVLLLFFDHELVVLVLQHLFLDLIIIETPQFLLRLVRVQL